MSVYVLSIVRLGNGETYGTRKKILSPTGRLLIMLLTMGDAIRRMFTGSRPIDWIILAIEFLVLLIIAWEFYWHVQQRSEARRYEQDLKAKLDALTPEEREGLKALLKGGQPKLVVAISLTNKVYGLVLRMPHGLEIAPDSREFITRWFSK
jgi:hypothetical protein